MYKWIVVSVFLVLLAEAGYSQPELDTLFTVRQESLPLNDSGGRWLSSALIITSISNYPQEVHTSTPGVVLDYGLYDRDSVWKMADSAYYIADSIQINTHQFGLEAVSGTPWKYIDSTFDFAYISFHLPAHGTLRIPIKIQAITQRGAAHDTASHLMQIYSLSDSAGIRRYSVDDFQLRCITNYSAPYGAWQGSVPPNDSGGRWLQSSLVIESVSPYASHLHVQYTNGDFSYPQPGSSKDSTWKLADSALYLADSIYVYERQGGGNVFFAADKPWDYIDSIHTYPGDGRSFSASFNFLLPAHATLHIPILVRGFGIPRSGVIDTVYRVLNIQSFAETDSNRVYFGRDVLIGCVPACSGPNLTYKGIAMSNKDNPVAIGQGLYRFPTQCMYCSDLFSTTVSAKIAGEYPDRFLLPDSNEPSGLIGFLGAPKSPIYDTLIASYTNCWGTITTRTPIEAYSIFPNTYSVSPIALSLKAPFLGKATGNAAKVINTSDFPITLRDLRATGYDSSDFEASAPSMIAAHDSAYITVTLKDKNLYIDTLYQARYSPIAGIIAPYHQELGFKDSVISFSVTGSIDVYCPYYFSLIPLLKQGVHPAGIIFTSSVSSLSGPNTFLTVYGNNDSIAEYFGMPYYDDPHFKLSIDNYTGLGTVFLPGVVEPSKSISSPSIEVLTTFTGDSYHNYQTQLHWPREHDTVTIDVVCLGTSAQRFEEVSSSESISNIRIWPNPASTVIHIDVPTSAMVSFTDQLGRVLLKHIISPESPIIDISILRTGVYQIGIPSLQGTGKLQVIR